MLTVAGGAGWHGGGLPAQETTAYRTAMAEAVRGAASAILESVVSIEIVGAAAGGSGEVAQDAPTCGVIVDRDGYILASSIVTRRPAASILVRLPDGTRQAATVVARDRHRDLILLKIPSQPGLQPIDLSDQPPRQIGQTTIAVGRYGRDAEPLVSTGVLSAVDRLDGIALQTDARVSPSFYGGPLIDLHGRVLGILVPAVAEGGAPDETSWYDSGIAFAIPAEMVVKNLPRLRQGEDIHKGLIGIVAKSRDPYEDDTTVAAVRTRSPAEAAGLKAGDRILSVAGKPVRRQQQIKQALGPFDAGDTVAIEVQREGEQKRFEVVLTDSIPPLEPQRLGAVVATREVDDDEPTSRVDESKETEAEKGDREQADASTRAVVQAVLPGSPADGKLQPGDVIVRVGETDIADVRSLRRMLITAEPGASWSIRIKRDGATEQAAVELTDVAGKPVDRFPETWETDDPGQWTIEELRLPDAANDAAVVRPKPERLAAANPPERLGLLVVLLNPGQGAPQEAASPWLEAAARSGVVVCAVAPTDNRRWQPNEIDVISRMTASLRKQLPIDPSAVAVAAPGALAGGDAEAADSMALMVSIAEARTFMGVAISHQTRPPAVRLRENEPAASLQLLLPVTSEDDLPSWCEALKARGYPIVRGGAISRESLLRWTRCLQAL